MYAEEVWYRRRSSSLKLKLLTNSPSISLALLPRVLRMVHRPLPGLLPTILYLTQCKQFKGQVSSSHHLCPFLLPHIVIATVEGSKMDAYN